MVRLIYASAVSESCTAEEFVNILKTAQANNVDVGATGMLCFSSQYFLQWLEGTRQSVNALYARIVCDARHATPEILDYAEVHARTFAQWSMAHVSVEKVHRHLVATYCPAGAFNPYEMTGEGARRFMEAVAESRAGKVDSA